MSFAGKVLSAVKSNYVGMLVRVTAQLVAQVAIMRLLGPELVGTFGYVLLLSGVFALLVDQGFGWSLIQGNFDNDEISVVFSRLMLGGILAAIAVYFISFPVAAWLANPEAGEVIRWSSPAYLLIGPYCISHAFLRRDLKFRELQFATNGAYVIAYPVVGLTLAFAGCGVWALFGAWYTQGLLQIAIGHRYATHSFRLSNPFRRSRAAPLGRQVASINILNWAVENSAGVFVARLGPFALGSYNAASVLARQPAIQLVQTLQGLLFSTATAIDDDAARIRRLYLVSLAVVGFFVGPLYGYFTSHGEFLIGLLFGQKWLSAGHVLSALSLGMTAMALSTVTGSILTAKDGQRVVVVSQAICLAMMLIGLTWAASRTVEAIAWVVSAAYVFRFLMQVVTVVSTRVVSWSDIVQTLRGPIVLSLLAAVPLSHWVAAGKWQLLAEICGLGTLLLVAVALVRCWPGFFLSPAFVEVLSRLHTGRRVLRALRFDGANF